MSASSTRSWFELNWLRKGDKAIPLPNIVFTSALTEYSGIYYRPEPDELRIRNRYYDLIKGLIVVSTNDDDSFLYKRDDETILKTIIHEWRHHWQYFTRKFYVEEATEFQDDGDYDQSVVEFYLSNVNEMDAFLFSTRKVKCNTNMYQFDLLRNAGILTGQEI